MVMLTDVEISRAYRLGYLAGKDRLRILDACPYERDQRVLRYEWARGYAAGKVDATPDWWQAVQWWWRKRYYGTGEL